MKIAKGDMSIIAQVRSYIHKIIIMKAKARYNQSLHFLRSPGQMYLPNYLTCTGKKNLPSHENIYISEKIAQISTGGIDAAIFSFYFMSSCPMIPCLYALDLQS